MLNLKYIIPALFCLFCLSCAQGEQEGKTIDVEKIDSLRKDPTFTLELLNEQIEKEPDNYGLFQDRSELYFGLDSLDNAIKDIEEAIKLYEKGPDLHYWRGFLSFIKNDTAAARESYQKAIGLGSQNPEVYYQLGQVYFFQNKYKAAENYYLEAIKYDPKDPQYNFALGFLEEKRQNVPKAIKFYLESLKKDSSFAKSLLQLHDLYINHHSNELEARKYNQQLLNTNLGHPLGNYNEGKYQYGRAIRAVNGGDEKVFAEALNTAILHLTIATDNDPDFADAFYVRGLAYLEGGQQVDNAIKDFQRTIELNPAYAQAHFMLGSIFEANGDLKGALGYFKEAYRLKPDGQGFRKAVQEVSRALK
ncbi:MAG: tetratricopeptide repeat protein [Bacteroidia bacterium]|nr:tetratricopeptide repeat protein [Bacteroidia bacterium]